jgi:hypothetical protein
MNRFNHISLNAHSCICDSTAIGPIVVLLTTLNISNRNTLPTAPVQDVSNDGLHDRHRAGEVSIMEIRYISDRDLHEVVGVYGRKPSHGLCFAVRICE